MQAMWVLASVLAAAIGTPTDDLFEAVQNDDKKRIGAALHHGADINSIVCLPSFFHHHHAYHIRTSPRHTSLHHLTPCLPSSVNCG
jgi:hypothetical protein